MKKLLKPLIILILATSLASCAGTKNIALTREQLSVFKNKSVIVVRGKVPHFYAMTPKNVTLSVLTGGIIGGFLMIYDGDKIIKENQIEDPSHQIAMNIVKHLETKHGVKVVGDENFKDSKNISKLALKFAEKSDYSIVVDTLDWSFGYLPMKLDNFRVLYNARVRFIDLKNQKVIAEGLCKIFPNEKEIKNSAPSYEELIINNARILKDTLRSYSNNCSEVFIKEIFSSEF